MSAVPTTSGRPANAHDDVKRVPTSKAYVAFLSSLAEGAMLLNENPTDPMSSAPLESYPLSSPNTGGMISSQSKVSPLPVAPLLKDLSISGSGVLLATSSYVLPRA